jgi:hypothetical protein
VPRAGPRVGGAWHVSGAAAGGGPQRSTWSQSRSCLQAKDRDGMDKRGSGRKAVVQEASHRFLTITALYLRCCPIIGYVMDDRVTCYVLLLSSHLPGPSHSTRQSPNYPFKGHRVRWDKKLIRQIAKLFERRSSCAEPSDAERGRAFALIVHLARPSRNLHRGEISPPSLGVLVLGKEGRSNRVKRRVVLQSLQIDCGLFTQ